MDATQTTTDRAEWLEASRALLAQEKAATRELDRLATERRTLPWLRLPADYTFEGADGPVPLAEVFGDHDQLLIYHFMFGVGWDEGCPSCSFWADSFNGVQHHLAARNVAFACVSGAPIDDLLAYRDRMGWDFRWLSVADSGFNHELGMSHTAEQVASGELVYNHGTSTPMGEESGGLSALARDDDGAIHLTYQTFGRGVEAFNTAYSLLDLAPAGRDEQDLPFSMAWVRRHDEYPNP